MVKKKIDLDNIFRSKSFPEKKLESKRKYNLRFVDIVYVVFFLFFRSFVWIPQTLCMPLTHSLSHLFRSLGSCCVIYLVFERAHGIRMYSMLSPVRVSTMPISHKNSFACIWRREFHFVFFNFQLSIVAAWTLSTLISFTLLEAKWMRFEWECIIFFILFELNLICSS